MSEVEQSIINKFSSVSAVNNFGKVTYLSEPFRITTNGKVGRGESAYDLENYDKRTDENNIAVVYMNTNKEPYAMYTSLSKVPSRVELVPIQDFISDSDIDWSQSIADIDQQLYKKYNLTDEEISYIEKTIKPM